MKKLKTLLIGCTAYIPAAFAGTKSHQDSQTTFFILCALILPVLAYTGNKWRMWWVGFQFGSADKSDFFSSFKWTLASVVWTGLVALMFSKFA